MSVVECLEEGCEEEAKVRGRCKRHHARHYSWMVSHGGYKKKEKSPPVECLEEGCEERARSRGRCSPHYARYIYRLNPEKARKKQRQYTRRRKERQAVPLIPERQGKQQTRECLKCGRKFPSEGIHNRLCPACQQANQGIDKRQCSVGRSSRSFRDLVAL